MDPKLLLYLPYDSLRHIRTGNSSQISKANSKRIWTACACLISLSISSNHNFINHDCNYLLNIR